MAIRAYDFRIQANFTYDASRVFDPPTDPRLVRFDVWMWSGRDDEGWCVYRRCSFSGEVVRIDFRP